LKDIRLVVLSGPSGSGKSTAIKALEDIGYFCVDNLPVSLLPKFMELLEQSREISMVAVVVDVREREFLKGFSRVFSGLKEAGYNTELLYLEATDEAIARRFSETRRRHPIAGQESPLEGVARERELLKEVRSHADKVIDTTGFNVHQLREVVKQYYTGPVTRERMVLNLISFGFRYGVPTDADIVMDIRFLPNPYFIESLKGLDGTDGSVVDFVLACQETKEFLARFKDFLSYLIPLYLKEGKSYLTIAVGCTGGRHRSVVVADLLTDELTSDVVVVRRRHRDIKKV
jgi:UPF0042 nucleotide-binding protein